MMADKKFTQLAAATTPLDGTEILAVVQSGASKQATVSAVLSSAIASGTANGVAFLNASKVLSTGSALTFDGAALNVTSGVSAGLIQSTDTVAGVSFLRILGDCVSGNLINWTTGTRLRFATSDGAFGGFSEVACFTATGLGIGTSSPLSKLSVNQSADGFEAGITLSRSGANRGTIFLDATNDTLNFGRGTAAVSLTASGNFGLGVTPSAWSSSRFAMQLGARASLYGANNLTVLGNNYYDDGANNRYIATGTASDYYQSAGSHVWRTAPSGTAGDAISFTQAMTLDASGRLLLAATTALAKFTVAGDISVLDSASAGYQLKLTSLAGESVLDAYQAGGQALVIKTTLAGSSAERARFTAAGDFIHQVNSSAPTLGTNSTMSWELTSDTSLKVVVRGSDGTTRSATLTLS